MLCINLIHCRIDIFDTNQWKLQDIMELHSMLKDKTQLIYDALCKAMLMMMLFMHGRTLNYRMGTRGYDQ
jgi:hypothetical protein